MEGRARHRGGRGARRALLAGSQGGGRAGGGRGGAGLFARAPLPAAGRRARAGPGCLCLPVGAADSAGGAFVAAGSGARPSGGGSDLRTAHGASGAARARGKTERVAARGGAGKRADAATGHGRPWRRRFALCRGHGVLCRRRGERRFADFHGGGAQRVFAHRPQKPAFAPGIVRAFAPARHGGAHGRGGGAGSAPLSARRRPWFPWQWAP